MHEPRIAPGWKPFFDSQSSMPYFKELMSFVSREYNEHECYPPQEDLFRAFEYKAPEAIKVVILGQDPYINPNQAHGLAFSVASEQPLPPSLKNIFSELQRDLGGETRLNGDLSHWAEQGVLLLNTTLTVRAKRSGSHAGQGWEHFTNAVIAHVSQVSNKVVFLLWGGYAKKKAALVDPKHLVLKAPHPSPLSAYRGFIGCGHFSAANQWLSMNGLTPISW